MAFITDDKPVGFIGPDSPIHNVNPTIAQRALAVPGQVLHGAQNVVEQVAAPVMNFLSGPSGQAPQPGYQQAPIGGVIERLPYNSVVRGILERAFRPSGPRFGETSSDEFVARPGVPMWQPEGTMMQPQGNQLQQLGAGMLTPGNALLGGVAGVGGVPARVVSGYFGAQGATALPGDIQQGDTSKAVLDAMMLLGGAHGALHETTLPKQDTSFRTPQNGGDLYERLTRIAQNPKSPFAKRAQEILDSRSEAVQDVPVNVNPDLQKAGSFQVQDGARSIDLHPEMTDSDFVTLHEAIHALTTDRLKSEKYGPQVQALFEEAQKAPELEGLHGMESLDEFTAEYASNPAFRQALKGVRYGEQSLLDKVKNLTYAIAGRGRERGSLLEATRGAVEPVINEPVSGRITESRLQRQPTPKVFERPDQGQFVVDPSGQVLDFGQLSEAEQREAMRGPREYRAPQKREARGEVPIIGQQPREGYVIVQGQEQQGPQPQRQIYIPRAYQQGGQISFEGQGVPNARQVAGERGRPDVLPPREPSQGVTGPGPASYRAPETAPTLEEYQRRLARESVQKGLTQKSGQIVGDEPLPYQKEGQYPEEGGPTGTLSKLQRERIQAGKVPRTNVKNNPPLFSGADYESEVKKIQDEKDLGAKFAAWGKGGVEKEKNKNEGMPPGEVKGETQQSPIDILHDLKNISTVMNQMKYTKDITKERFQEFMDRGDTINFLLEGGKVAEAQKNLDSLRKDIQGHKLFSGADVEPLGQEHTKDPRGQGLMKMPVFGGGTTGESHVGGGHEFMEVTDSSPGVNRDRARAKIIKYSQEAGQTQEQGVKNADAIFPPDKRLYSGANVEQRKDSPYRLKEEDIRSDFDKYNKALELSKLSGQDRKEGRFTLKKLETKYSGMSPQEYHKQFFQLPDNVQANNPSVNLVRALKYSSEVVPSFKKIKVVSKPNLDPRLQAKEGKESVPRGYYDPATGYTYIYDFGNKIPPHEYVETIYHEAEHEKTKGVERNESPVSHAMQVGYEAGRKAERVFSRNEDVKFPVKEEGQEKLFSGADVEDKGPFRMQIPDVLRDKSKGGFASNVQVDSQQLVNRLKNLAQQGKVSGSELEYLKGQGLEEFLKTKPTVEEVANWVEGKTPKTEVKVLRSGGEKDSKVAQNERKMAELQHELETKGYETFATHLYKQGASQSMPVRSRSDSTGRVYNEPIPKEVEDLYNKWYDLKLVTGEQRVRGFDPDTYRSIAPKDADQDVVMVRVPTVEDSIPKDERSPRENSPNARKERQGILHQGNHFGPEDRNVLGWARIQWEKGKNGEKIAHVIEVQSDWAAETEKLKKLIKEAEETKDDVRPGGLLARNDAERVAKLKQQDHPLLPNWQRLTLKAAIEHAKKEGADRVALSDAETAMMTEGHDLHAVSEPTVRGSTSSFKTKEEAEAHLAKQAESNRIDSSEIEYTGAKYLPWELKYQSTPMPSQAKGMRLNYDSIGPKILQELTGKKGERAEFGEHQRAMEPASGRQIGMGFPTREAAVSYAKNAYNANSELHGRRAIIQQEGNKWTLKWSQPPRDNLIFRDPLTGKPKTSATGLSYDLSDVKGETQKPSVFGKKLYSGAPIEEPGMAKKAKDVFDAMKTVAYNRSQTSQLLDAADNMAKIRGQREGNRIKVSLSDKIDRQALTFIVESKGDRAKLNEFASLVKDKNPTAEAAIAKAINSYDRLRPYADEFTKRLDQQRDAEHAVDIKAEHLEGYTKHSFEEDTGLFDIGSGGAGVSTSFLKDRTYPNYATAIAAGEKPRSLDSASLLDSRVAAGQKLMNRQAWVKRFETTPTSEGKTLTTPFVKKGDAYVAPRGYTSVELAPGVRAAVDNDYVKLMKALTGESAVRNSDFGTALLTIESAIKHGMLAFDSFHAFRVMRKQLFSSGKVGYQKGVSLLENDQPTIERMVKNGDIDPKTAKWIRENRPTADLLVKNGLNVGRISERLLQDVTDDKLWRIGGVRVNIARTFNGWVFQKLTRGATLQTALLEFDKVKKNNPTWSNERVAAYTSKQMNVWFGNLQRQGIFKSQTFRDLSQIAFLAPQWTESLIQSEGRGFTQLAKVPFTGKVGPIGRSIATGVAAYLIANQIINMYTKGHPTWENEEGHKLDAYLPDPVDTAKRIKRSITGEKQDEPASGYWLSPINDVAEMTHDLIKYKGDAGRIVQNKLSPLGRAEETLRQGRDYSGTKLDMEERLKEAGKSLLPTPLPLAGYMSETPKQTGRQIYSTLGWKVEPDYRMHEEALEKMVGKKFEDMSIKDRLIGEYKLDKNKPKLSDSQQEKIEMRGTELSIQRKKELNSAMSKADKGWLQSRELTLPSYENKVSFTGDELGTDKAIAVTLTKKEQERYKEVLLEKYTRGVRVLRGMYDTLSSEADKQKLFTEMTLEVRKQAREQMKRELAGKR